MATTLDLSGRRALVTGGGQGVGRGIAMALAAAGAEVAVNDLDPGRAGSVCAEIGAAARASVFDVTDYAAVTAAVGGLGGVDILVNNAGNAGAEGFELGPFAATEPADWDRYLAVNLLGVMHCCRAVLPPMIESRWGRLVTVVSDAGRVGDNGMAAYCAAKAGAAGLTRALAIENGRFGITANNVALGTIRTPASEGMWSEPDNPRAKAMLQRYVIRRPGSPEDIAGLVTFLASDQASWVTGQTYPVNGGYSFAL